MLAAALREHVPAPGAAVLDVCTGSGMLAVQAALLGARATAVDVMRRALLSACREVADHLRPGGSVLLVHSSVCGVQRTLDELTATGLEAGVIARSRGPLGPLLRERAADLWATGALPAGSLEEEIVVVRGRRPAAQA